MTIPLLHFRGTVMAVFQTVARVKKSEPPAGVVFCDEW